MLKKYTIVTINSDRPELKNINGLEGFIFNPVCSHEYSKGFYEVFIYDQEYWVHEDDLIDTGRCKYVPKPKFNVGEVPHAIVEKSKYCLLTVEELIRYAELNLAKFMVPKKYSFCELPKTATGKIQKNLLKEIMRKSDNVEYN
jgi:acyl-CoA synthetase (AMP-forming)/AMP-acid ligase II